MRPLSHIQRVDEHKIAQEANSKEAILRSPSWSPTRTPASFGFGNSPLTSIKEGDDLDLWNSLPLLHTQRSSSSPASAKRIPSSARRTSSTPRANPPTSIISSAQALRQDAARTSSNTHNPILFTSFPALPFSGYPSDPGAPPRIDGLPMGHPFPPVHANGASCSSGNILAPMDSCRLPREVNGTPKLLHGGLKPMCSSQRICDTPHDNQLTCNEAKDTTSASNVNSSVSANPTFKPSKATHTDRGGLMSCPPLLHETLARDALLNTPLFPKLRSGDAHWGNDSELGTDNEVPSPIRSCLTSQMFDCKLDSKQSGCFGDSHENQFCRCCLGCLKRPKQTARIEAGYVIQLQCHCASNRSNQLLRMNFRGSGFSAASRSPLKTKKRSLVNNDDWSILNAVSGSLLDSPTSPPDVSDELFFSCLTNLIDIVLDFATKAHS